MSVAATGGPSTGHNAPQLVEHADSLSSNRAVVKEAASAARGGKLVIVGVGAATTAIGADAERYESMSRTSGMSSTQTTVNRHAAMVVRAITRRTKGRGAAKPAR